MASPSQAPPQLRHSYPAPWRPLTLTLKPVLHSLFDNPQCLPSTAAIIAATPPPTIPPSPGVIPESEDVLNCSNVGQPVIMATQSDAGECYEDLCERFLGVEKDFRHIDVKPQSFFGRIFG